MYSSIIPALPSNSMADSIEEGCARIFREVISLSHPIHVTAWKDARLLAEPLEAIDVDSLSLLDFVMQVEDAYGVELDEAAVSNCRTIRELAALVATAERQFGTATR
jgi:acyl carrier protein